MFEKVNPSHPDKVADRIAGAVVDLCYTKSKNPKVACEVLIGHACNLLGDAVSVVRVILNRTPFEIVNMIVSWVLVTMINDWQIVGVRNESHCD